MADLISKTLFRPMYFGHTAEDGMMSGCFIFDKITQQTATWCLQEHETAISIFDISVDFVSLF